MESAQHKENGPDSPGADRIRLRSSPAGGNYVKVRAGDFFATVDRSFCEADEFRELMSGIDERMQSGQILKDEKNSRSTCVVRLRLSGHDVMIKRYNYKGLAHSLGRTIQGSRARYNWIWSQSLMRLGIPSPRPFAFVEMRWGPLVWKSYSLCEYVDAKSLRQVLEQGNCGTDELTQVAMKVRRLLSLMAERKVTHGDLKLDNILLRDDAAIVVDLDQVRIHRCEPAYRRRRAQDLATLRRYTRRFPQFDAILDRIGGGLF